MLDRSYLNSPVFSLAVGLRRTCCAAPALRLSPLSSSDRAIQIMVSRLTLALKKAAGKDPYRNDGIFTAGSFVARTPLASYRPGGRMSYEHGMVCGRIYRQENRQARSVYEKEYQ